MDLLTEFKPYYGFSNLAPGHYEVECFRFVKNRFYKPDVENPDVPRSLMVELKDQVLFLPSRFAKRLDNDDGKLA